MDRRAPLSWMTILVPLFCFDARAESPADFGRREVADAVRETDAAKDLRITFRLADDAEAASFEAEGFRVRRSGGPSGDQVQIIAKDEAGLMYGGLEVAEILRALGADEIVNDAQSPRMKMRGTKFNIPLDVRTPSYTDVCDAAQMNLPDMWDFDFWKEYIDTLARYRYNYVSLWSLHPFPSMVKVPEYPDVALDDVWRSRVDWDEHYPLQGRGFVTDEILADVEVVKKISIDDKIEFWRRVMAYGQSRNVDFYVVTWNIFTDATFGKYGITEDFRNPTTIDYFRRSVAAMVRTYPDLAGIGLTTGENMSGANFQDKEDWALATYGLGVTDAMGDFPDRQFRFIHRQHEAETSDIKRTFRALIEHPNIDFIFSFKYAKAHVYSATRQPYHEDFVKHLGETKTIWTLRNDDIYCFRWAAPDFVREFVKNIPSDVTQGYYYGSDQFVWGREFLEREAGQSRPLEIEKHWLQWLLWGRFAYDPDVGNDRIAAILAERFDLSVPQGQRLLQAWQNVSMVYPITTGFHWGPLDFQWYIEGCQSRESYAQNDTGFHDVNRFINLKPHANSGYQSIPDFAKAPAAEPRDGRRTPLEVADLIDRHLDDATTSLASFRATGNSELARTIADVEIVTALGRYYAEKIRGAAFLAVHRRSGDPRAQQNAIDALIRAAEHWHRFATLATASYKNPFWTNRVGHVDWRQNYLLTLEDVRIAGGDPEQSDLPAAVEVDAAPVVRWIRD